MAELRLEHVSKTFDSGDRDVQALDDISIEIHEHEFVAFLGPSGCGKSTLLRIIAGLLQPTSGRVVYREGNKLELGDIGFVFQDYALFDWKTVEENLRVTQSFTGRTIDDETVQDYLEMVELTGFADAYPNELSGGMKQRAALARALIYDPDIVLMDEPFAALDEITKDSLYSHFQQILEQTDKTVVYVTHDIEEAYLFADRLVVMGGDGSILQTIDIDTETPRDRAILSTDEFYSTKQQVMQQIGDGG